MNILILNEDDFQLGHYSVELERRADVILVKTGTGYDCVKSRNTTTDDVRVIADSELYKPVREAVTRTHPLAAATFALPRVPVIPLTGATG